MEVAGEVRRGEDLIEGIKGLKKERIVVVLDELLQDGHGLKTLYQVLLLRAIPVVVLSASRSSDCWLECWRAGALDCLQWPSSDDEAREVVAGIIRALDAVTQTPSLWGIFGHCLPQ